MISCFFVWQDFLFVEKVSKLKEDKTIADLMINEQIRDKEVRVIGANNEQLGVMSIEEARKLAEEAGVDLVKIAPNAAPPVCRIIDYGKFRYEQARKEKEAKKKQKVIEIKENPYIGRDDLRHVRALHWDYDNKRHVGEMVCKMRSA